MADPFRFEETQDESGSPDEDEPYGGDTPDPVAVLALDEGLDPDEPELEDDWDDDLVDRGAEPGDPGQPWVSLEESE